MSEQAAEPTGGETGSLNAGVSPSVDSSSEPAVVSAPNAAHEAIPAEMTAADAPVTASSTSEAPKAEASGHVSQPEASRPEISRLPGKVIVMSRGDRAWADNDTRSEPEDERQSVLGKRRMAAMAAMVALAAAAGVLGGALATSAFTRSGNDVASNGSQTSVEASLSRLDADIQALKSGLEHTSKLGMNQFNKTSDRLDKLERAQAEPAAKIAKLGEAVDRLRATPAGVPAASSAKEVTGSIPAAPASQAAAVPAAPKNEAKIEAKTEVGRMPTVEDWVLRDVAYGGALIYGRRGVYEVYAGDTVPGLGRVDAIRRQDGRWVVVTSRGLIVAR